MARKSSKPTQVTLAERPALCVEIQRLQRERSILEKSHLMQANRLRAVVAGTLGYNPNLEEAERKAKFTEAAAVIGKVREEDDKTAPLYQVIRATLIGLDALAAQAAEIKEAIQAAAKRLPTVAWVTAPAQKGFSWLLLGSVVGECGDLANYATAPKVWKRMGCAPWTFGEHTLMPSSWRWQRAGIKLPKEEWEKMGYCPRRRSVAWNIGELIVRSNFHRGEPGPYRRHYLRVKEQAAALHPDWRPIHVDQHARLLATKRLLKNLWRAWNALPEEEEDATPLRPAV